MMWGANLGLLLVVFLFVAGLVGMTFRQGVLDFAKANFGLLVLLLLFMTLLAVSFHVFHEQSTNALSKDFLAWLEQKAGEVLAAVMTLIVGIRNTNQRLSDQKPTPVPPVTLPGSMSTLMPVPPPTSGSTTTTLGVPH
jgi:hypothetical protein